MNRDAGLLLLLLAVAAAAAVVAVASRAADRPADPLLPSLVPPAAPADPPAEARRAFDFSGRGGERDITIACGVGDLSARTRSPADVRDLALEWLKEHQNSDGSWGARGDVDETGLALLAFLGAGNTHRTGEYRETVKRGLQHLRLMQDAEGCFADRGDPEFVRKHAIAALACCEAYAWTGSPVLKPSAQKGVDFALACRNPAFAWGRGARAGENDTRTSAWMTMALASARGAGLAVDEEAFRGMRAWLDLVTDPVTGRVGATRRDDDTDETTALGMFARIVLGEDPTRSDPLQAGAELLRGAPPAERPGGDPADRWAWIAGTWAMFECGGKPWDDWNRALQATLLASQRTEGDKKGSWDPAGGPDEDDGRVAATALSVLCLRVYYHWYRPFGRR